MKGEIEGVGDTGRSGYGVDWGNVSVGYSDEIREANRFHRN